MANKLYEEEEVRQIAVSLRANAPRKIGQKELLLSEMSSGVDDVYLEGYENGGEQGYNLGLIDGEEKVKTEEARTVGDITYLTTKTDVTITVPSGYYANTESKILDDLDLIKDAQYDQGLEDGYNDGYIDGYDDGYDVGFEAGSAGGVVWELPDEINFSNEVPNVTISFNSAGIDFVGIRGGGQNVSYIKSDGTMLRVRILNDGWVNEVYKTITILEKITDEAFLTWLEANATLISGESDVSSDVDEMMLLNEHEWEGEPPFYSYNKWIDYGISNLSSAPVVVSVENSHESKYIHVYVYADAMNIGEIYETIVIPPANEENGWYSFNSLEIDMPCYDVYVMGIRWSDDGV